MRIFERHSDYQISQFKIILIGKVQFSYIQINPQKQLVFNPLALGQNDTKTLELKNTGLFDIDFVIGSNSTSNSLQLPPSNNNDAKNKKIPESTL